MASLMDIHCHLLPGVDDGPQNQEEALILARSLADKGFSQVVATPHYIEDYSQDYQQRVAAAHGRLVSAIESAKIPLTVHLGGELLLIPRLADLAARGGLPTLKESPFVLVELPLSQPLPLYAGEVFFALMSRGYAPILAHPERMAAFRNRLDGIHSLTEKGIYIQVNLGSLAGLYGKTIQRNARDILKKGLAHFLATDSHSPRHLDRVKDLLEDPGLTPLLVDNPGKALSGAGTITPHIPKPASGFRERAIKIFRRS